MRDLTFGKTLNVLFQYGLRPISLDGDVITIVDPERQERLVFSAGTDDEVPEPMLDKLLEYIGMDKVTFWQLYEAV